jgi:hypothetical protein
MVQAEDPDCRGKALLSATCGVDFGCKGVEGILSAAMARKASNSGSSETLVR